jgi:hypothetical protein
MIKQQNKIVPIVGCCGLDCGLCPRYYTEGKSKCNGCGSEYSYAAVGCKIFKCCFKEKNFETCAECNDFPCSRFTGAWEDYDSFLTHKKMFSNLNYIREKGWTEHGHNVKRRMDLLRKMLEGFNDGKSRSYYCIVATLLPVADLEASLAKAEEKINTDEIRSNDLKARSKILRSFLDTNAVKNGIELKLRKKAKGRS